ncbi:MAG: hypothetical protein KC457_35730, partial [Myxococcales bacterium]|nr:hypothetical protein [Myxococcales bacterium]
WPSMAELLLALARDPERIRKRRWRIAGAAVAVLTVISMLGAEAATESSRSARKGYWNSLTEDLLEIERERGLKQANDDARRARNAARMSGYQRYRPREGLVVREDPTLAATLLREVEGSSRNSAEWISAANEILGQPISYAVLSGHRSFIRALVFAPDSSALYSAAGEQVWRWEMSSGVGRPIIEHEREIMTLAVGPDGRYVASGGKDSQVRVWDRDGGGLVRTFA